MRSYSVAVLERGVTDDQDGHLIWSNASTTRHYSVEAADEAQAIAEVMAWGLHADPEADFWVE
jgi:hypothetical protein